MIEYNDKTETVLSKTMQLKIQHVAFAIKKVVFQECV